MTQEVCYSVICLEKKIAQGSASRKQEMNQNQ